MEFIKSPIKWVGGKYEHLSKIIEHFPDISGDYIEPFLGGGAVLLAVLQHVKVCGTVRASDSNKHLINFWECLKSQPDLLIERIDYYVELYNAKYPQKPLTATQSEMYYHLRDVMNGFSSVVRSCLERAACFYIINQTCFRGLYRENSKRELNVSFGNYKHIRVDAEHLREVSKLIQRVVFHCWEFTIPLGCAGNNDFVYCDPPYMPEADGKGFVGYQKGGFDHDALFTALQETKAWRICSNSSGAREMYKECSVSIQWRVKRRITSKGAHKVASEVLYIW